MNIFSKLSLRNLKKNHNRTLITIIGVVLATAMIAGLTSLVASFQGFLIKQEIAESGSWHVKYESSFPEEAGQVIEATEVNEYVFSQDIGYAEIDNKNEYKPYLYLTGISSDFTNLLPLYLSEGRLPESSNEIILPNHFIESTDKIYKIGDAINLDIGKRYPSDQALEFYNSYHADSATQNTNVENGLTQNEPYILDKSHQASEYLEIEQTTTYIITGFYHKSNLEPHTAAGYMAITSADANQREYLTNYYMELDNYRNAFSFIDQFKLEANLEANYSLLRYFGVSGNDSFMTFLISLTILFLIIIVLSSVVLINNAFAISLAERTKQAGILSSIGASRKQLKRTIMTEVFLISALGIPLGILGGLAGIKLTLLGVGKYIKDILVSSSYVNIDLDLMISGKAILLAVILSLFTILISARAPVARISKMTAIDAIRQSQDIVAKPVKVSRLIYRIFGLPGFLANKYFKRSRKKYSSTIISLVLSLVLFVSAYTFTTLMQTSVQDIYNSTSSDIQYTIYADQAEFSPEKIAEQIEGLSKVTDVSRSINRTMIYFAKEELLTSQALNNLEKNYSDYKLKDQGKDKIYSYLDFIFIEDQDFSIMLQELNIEMSDYLSLDGYYPLVKNLHFFQDYENKNFVKYDFFKKDIEEDIELVTFKDRPDYHFSGVSNQESSDQSSKLVFQDYENNLAEEIPLSDAIDENVNLRLKYFISETPDHLAKTDAVTLFFPLSKLKEFPKGDAEIIYNFHIRSADHTQTENALSQFITEEPDVNSYRQHIINYTANRQSSLNITKVVDVFCYGFIILISLIALTNVFNTITTNINLRTRDFAMLKSVGLTSHDLKKMMGFECFLYGTRSLFWGIPLAITFSYLVYKAINVGVQQNYQVPWIALILATVAIFIFVITSMVFAMRQIKKKNIIEALRNENS